MVEDELVEPKPRNPYQDQRIPNAMPAVGHRVEDSDSAAGELYHGANDSDNAAPMIVETSAVRERRAGGINEVYWSTESAEMLIKKLVVF
jgi:hypothetical protein